jgi:ATP/maltotriose-dependent transcriptional regulator MalT
MNDPPDADNNAIARRDPTPKTNDRPGSRILPNAAWESVARKLDLSPMELRIVQAIFNDCSELTIAEQFQVAPATIHTHCRRLYTKLHVSNRVALVLLVLSPYVAHTPDGVH